MKKFLKAAVVVILISMNMAGVSSNQKVTICHREGNGSSHEITVSINALPAHLAHGDRIGSCGGGGGE